ncbi:hypothetical protein Tco_1200694 [Tanacetum coccineum]
MNLRHSLVCKVVVRDHMQTSKLKGHMTLIVRRFEMMKYSFNADEEYIAIKESEYLNYSKDSLDAYRELSRIIDEGWVMATPDEE